MTNILLVDDNETIVSIVREYLKREGFEVLTAYNGEDALNLINREHIDLAVLDIMLPGVDGYALASQLKLQGTPVIFLSAKSQEDDLLYGFELQADDYVTKPFSPNVLMARIKAVLRRVQDDPNAQEPAVQKIRHQDLEIDLKTHEVFLKDELINLTNTEYLLLTLLLSHPGQVFSRQQMIDHLSEAQSINEYQDIRSIDAHIKNLRKKLHESPKQQNYIITVIGAGYKSGG
ncbi:MAG: response regulator transcription factor [Coriobacteriia bacterium]|nr:response regulator transcription factor [Coriobacteriia bacterium]